SPALPHGPKPPALKAFMDGSRPEVHQEVGIMADFANPTQISEFALGLSRPDYMKSWAAYNCFRKRSVNALKHFKRKLKLHAIAGARH
ncbi:MAG: hypothetical protein AAB354_03945, partial [candidate division KSB1 bacterium]